MKIYIITGESSGDQHASQIAKQLFIQDKKTQIKAWGGKNLINEGVSIDTVSYTHLTLPTILLV